MTASVTRDLGARATLHEASHLFVERDASILARRAGVIREVKAARGERVRSGQVLCILENTDLALAVDVARLEVDRARAAFERAGSLAGEKAISRESYEDAEFKLRSSERAAESAAQELEKSFVRAPFDGVVSARNVEIGQVLIEDDTRVLFRVTALGPLLARLYEPQWTYGLLHAGDRVVVRPDISPASPAQGTVRWINDVLDAASGSAEVLVEVAGAGRNDLRPGMSVTVDLVLHLPPGRLTIDRFALRGMTEGGSDGEVTVRDDAFERTRKVRLGFRGEDRVEILAGLREGEVVVLQQPVPATAPAPPAGDR